MTEPEKYYLTKEGLKDMKKERDKLLKLRKLKSKENVPSVMHSDELSAEFVSYREDLEFLESRLEEIDRIFKNYELIKKPPKKERERVCLGAYVSLKINGEKDEFRIVGTTEANPSAGKISNESPVGKALLGKKADEEIIVSSPQKKTYKILNIKYKSSWGK